MCIQYLLEGVAQEVLRSATQPEGKIEINEIPPGEPCILEWLKSDTLFMDDEPKSACNDPAILKWMENTSDEVWEAAPAALPFMGWGATTTRTSSRYLWGTGEPLPW